MRGVQNAGDVIGLTGLYTANNFRPFKPRRSEEVNKHTYPPKTKQKIIGKENMHSLWPFRFCLLKANHLRTNQGSAMLLHKHNLNEAEGALNVALGTRKQSNSSNSMWFGRIINQQWLRLMPQSNFVACGDLCCHWCLSDPLFQAVWEMNYYIYRMIHNLLRKIFGFAEHPRLHIR